MARRAQPRVVVATDGSPQARAAVAAALAFPWPPSVQVRAVVARETPGGAGELPAAVSAAVEARVAGIAADTRRLLRRRWPDAEVLVAAEPPVEAIVAESRRAAAVVVGSRGLGRLGRAVLGSVSRGVVRRAACPVLIVKQRPRGRTPSLVIGVDGSANARRAVAFVAGLSPQSGSRVTVVAVFERVRPRSLGLMPGALRAELARELAELNATREAEARRELARAAARLERAGWTVVTMLRAGIPADELIQAVAGVRADTLVVGARGTAGISRLLLGSVAEGVLDRCPASILLVR